MTTTEAMRAHNRGILHGKEIEYPRIQKMAKFHYISILFIGFFLFFITLILLGYSIIISKQVLSLLQFTTLFSLSILLFVVSFFAFVELKTRQRIMVYENGIVPFRRPYNYYTKNKEVFITWDMVEDITEKNNCEKWIFVLKLNEACKPIQMVTIASIMFSDEETKAVYEKLSDIKNNMRMK